MLGEHHLGGSERAENHVLDFKWQFFDAANRVLNARPNAVNDMKICFQFSPEHADRIKDAVLAVDVIVLNDRVKKRVLCRNAHFPRVDLYIFDILIVDLVALFGQDHASAVVETLDVAARDRDINTSNHHVAFLFGIDHRFVDAFHRRFKIHNLALAHTARWGLPDAQNS